MKSLPIYTQNRYFGELPASLPKSRLLTPPIEQPKIGWRKLPVFTGHRHVFDSQYGYMMVHTDKDAMALRCRCGKMRVF